MAVTLAVLSAAFLAESLRSEKTKKKELHFLVVYHLELFNAPKSPKLTTRPREMVISRVQTAIPARPII